LFFPKSHTEFYNLSELLKSKPDYVIEDHKKILRILNN
jgi:hypothetical protein